jgi:hypothetical protein
VLRALSQLYTFGSEPLELTSNMPYTTHTFEGSSQPPDRTQLQAKMNIRYAYATTSEGSTKATVILAVPDVAKALGVLGG